MGNVGLLYVGAVLFINGLMLIGVIPGKGAGILNFFVGTMQVVFPTIALMQSGGDPGIVFAAAGIYLFGFTYLYVGFIQWTGHGGEGLGWFSLFVVICAIVIAAVLFLREGDPFFGVVWLLWAALWFLFFVLLALHREEITVLTGWFTIFVSFITGTIPALILLTEAFALDGVWAIVLAVIGVASLLVSMSLGRKRVPKAPEPVAEVR